MDAREFFEEFHTITGIVPSFDGDYKAELARLVDYLSSQDLRPLRERRRRFLAHVNWKFRLNAEPLAKFYSEAAGGGFTFHYHQKSLIQRAFDLRDSRLLDQVLRARGVAGSVKQHLICSFSPVDEQRTLRHLANECREPTKLRKEKGDRDIKAEIVKALFSAFMWVSVPQRNMHKFFDPLYSDATYCESFWEQLHVRSPHLFSRDNALHVVRITQESLLSVDSMEKLRHAISLLLEQLYEAIDNYGFLAVMLEPLTLQRRQVEWEVAADAILFAGKHREEKLNKAYFRWERVRDETTAHISQLDVSAARFDLANEGFTYRDSFVLASRGERIQRLLLLFQKNRRDETPIPCPTCRSSNVQGNSYSSLGVRSWECKNALCPDRSKYNRGKRYSFRGLVMQRAIEDDRNEIPIESFKRWMRDVVMGATDDELNEMLVRHYSMCGDVVHVHNWSSFTGQPWGRRVKHHRLRLEPSSVHGFWTGPFFKRYVVPSSKSTARLNNLGDSSFQVLLGDSAEVLRNFPESTFDGAVTSPPYYNAREYAQWPNMYCHLHDIFNINREVYRTLKPEALYLYNVFDYFDNENTIVFSAMGKQRLPLSAYTVDIFRRIGFILIGNVVWDKGEIEGKRGYNAGNFSPYYQAPFNCWEHLLVFTKPAHNRDGQPAVKPNGFVSQVLREKPVMKMVQGRNTHGHSAPFPDTIPELLISQLPRGAVVLDPFAGSLTTGRAAERYGVRSVCIERREDYCRLGLQLRRRERTIQTQLQLF